MWLEACHHYTTLERSGAPTGQEGPIMNTRYAFLLQERVQATTTTIPMVVVYLYQIQYKVHYILQHVWYHTD